MDKCVHRIEVEREVGDPPTPGESLPFRATVPRQDLLGGTDVLLCFHRAGLHGQRS